MRDAAHGKFTKEEILEREQDIFQTLGCNLYLEHHLDSASQLLKKFLYENKEIGISREQEQEMYRFMGCMGQLIVHSVDLQSNSVESLGPALVWLTLKFFKNIYKYQLVLNYSQEIDQQP